MLACLVFAQQETGSITGQVVDPSGSVVPEAQVVITNMATSAVFTIRTDATGFYRAPNLSPGTYMITLKTAGFRALVREGVVLRVNDRLRIDLQPEIGLVSEAITIRGETPLLQTEDATVGQVIDNKRIIELPLNGRNWLQLATLAPATVTYPGVVDTSSGNSQNLLMNIGGNRTAQNNFLLDGSDHTMFVGGGGAIIHPPIDSIQEFKVQTNNYTADTGRLGGAVINATIKSGSNALHGSAYEFLRNRSLNARNFFAAPDRPKPQFTRNQFGASIGGPFLRNKMFFFLNYEGNRQRQDGIVTRQVFTDAEKAGNFAALGGQIAADAEGRPVLRNQIFDPFSLRRLANGSMIRDPFPANMIPRSRMNPTAKTLIDLVPPPNTAGSPNFVRNLSQPLNIDTFVGRLDFIRSEKNTLFSHFIHADQHSYTEPILGVPADGGNAVNYRVSNQRQAVLGWTHTVNPSNLNEFRLGYVRNATPVHSVQANEDLNARYGIPLPYPGEGVGGLAALTITGYTQIGTTLHINPQFVNKYEISDSFTAIRGAHLLKFGWRGGLKYFHNQSNSSWARGNLTFTGVYTRQISVANSGSAVADFLTGVVNSAQLGSVTNELDVGHDIEWFAQDQWRVNSKVTLTLGVRYQFNPPSWEARDLISSVVFDRGFTSARIVVPQGQDEKTFQFMRDVLFPYIPVRRAPELNRGLVRSTKLNFAPRLGIAYQFNSRTVLRTGYGIFYGFPDVVSGTVLTINPPLKLIITQTSNTVDPTMVINQPIFGTDPFRRAQVNPQIRTRDSYLPPDLTQMYNLSIQREVAPSWLVEVGFMGSRSSRVAIVTQVNDAYPALPSDTSSVQSRRRVSTVLGDIPFLAPQGYANYNAMILSLEKRFSGGLSLAANYTWSRAFGAAPAITNGINNTPVQDPFDLKREYGPLEFDVINRVSLSYVYDLPFGKGRIFLSGASRVLDLIIGGWQVNGIGTFQGGFPFTPVLGISLGKTTTSSRPNAIGDPKASSRQPHDWINRAAFAVPSNAEIGAGNFYGNAGRNSVHQPGLANFDFSVGKNFLLRESLRLQFRTEFFNLTNTPFFGIPGSVDANYNSATFGRVTQAGDPRIVQFGMKLLF